MWSTVGTAGEGRLGTAGKAAGRRGHRLVRGLVRGCMCVYAYAHAHAHVYARVNAVKWKKGPSHLLEWSRALNREFRHFVKVFIEGTNTAPIEMYQAYVAMAMEASDCTLPLQDLAANASATCNGITSSSSTPFGTLGMCELFLVNVNNSWVTLR